MKLFNFIVWTGICILVAFAACPAHAEAEVKKVCHDVNGKQVCKNVKVHKKVEGTPVPEKAPAPAKKPAKK
jgi:transcriptional regulator of nitric oxide reductase